jgi:hypothetical protein
VDDWPEFDLWFVEHWPAIREKVFARSEDDDLIGQACNVIYWRLRTLPRHRGNISFQNGEAWYSKGGITAPLVKHVERCVSKEIWRARANRGDATTIPPGLDKTAAAEFGCGKYEDFVVLMLPCRHRLNDHDRAALVDELFNSVIPEECAHVAEPLATTDELSHWRLTRQKERNSDRFSARRRLLECMTERGITNLVDLV